jgi:hypothetical protein
LCVGFFFRFGDLWWFSNGLGRLFSLFWGVFGFLGFCRGGG